MAREQLMEEFSKAGTVVDATIIVNKYTGRSKGFGFVEMSTPEEATAAHEMFHGKEVGGRVLIVNEARPETPRDEAGAPMEAPTDEEAPAADAEEAAVEEEAPKDEEA